MGYIQFAFRFAMERFLYRRSLFFTLLLTFKMIVAQVKKSNEKIFLEIFYVWWKGLKFFKLFK